MSEVVSIIVPVYNCEKFLPACLDSILAQTYEKIEVILIDDGSPDNSGKICDDYAHIDHRIKVIHRGNKGVSETRREGVLISKGEYIAFVDSDDYIEPNYIKTLMQKANETNADVVCCNCIDEGITNQPNICIKKECVSYHLQEMLSKYFDGYRFAYVLWGKVFRREILNNVDFIKLRYTEDTHMMLDIFTLSKTIVLIPYNGYHYRAQENSVMACANLMDLHKDNLVTAQYLLNICKCEGEPYYSLAKRKMIKIIFNAILVQCKMQYFKKAEIGTTHEELSAYINNFKTSQKIKYGLQGIIILFYEWFPRITSELIHFCYFIMRKK